MQTVLEQMLGNYKTNTTEEKKNALKEVVQEVALCGLSRAGFFKHAAFYGGTALRIFYGLDRFSEDLDFSLVMPNPDFQFNRYFSGVESELAALGLKFSIEEKQKTVDSAIKSAFLKGNTKEHILNIYDIQNIGINPDEVLYDMSSLFAGKNHAVICRSWKNRVKGRDLYDYVFYLSRQAKVNLPHLQARLEDSGAWKNSETLTLEKLHKMLRERFEMINYEQAKQDVLPFIADSNKLDLWSEEFFVDITKNLGATDNKSI